MNSNEQVESKKVPDLLFFAPLYFMILGVALMTGLNRLTKWYWQVVLSLIILVIYYILFKVYMKKVKDATQRTN